MPATSSTLAAGDSDAGVAVGLVFIAVPLPRRPARFIDSAVDGFLDSDAAEMIAAAGALECEPTLLLFVGLAQIEIAGLRRMIEVFDVPGFHDLRARFACGGLPMAKRIALAQEYA